MIWWQIIAPRPVQVKESCLKRIRDTIFKIVVKIVVKIV